MLDLAADHPVPLVLGSTTPGMFVSGADLAEIAERRLADGLARRLQYEDADTAARIHAFLDRRRR